MYVNCYIYIQYTHDKSPWNPREFGWKSPNFRPPNVMHLHGAQHGEVAAAPFPGFPGWKNFGALERSKYRNSNIVMDIVNIGYLEYVIYLLCVYWFDI
jgi:hypothetical protein